MKQVEEFFNKVKADDALKAEFKALTEKEGAADKIIAFAAEQGFTFTIEEWDGYIQKAREEDVQELSDDDVEKVAGGLIFASPYDLESASKIVCGSQEAPKIVQ